MRGTHVLRGAKCVNAWCIAPQGCSISDSCQRSTALYNHVEHRARHPWYPCKRSRYVSSNAMPSKSEESLFTGEQGFPRVLRSQMTCSTYLFKTLDHLPRRSLCQKLKPLIEVSVPQKQMSGLGKERKKDCPKGLQEFMQIASTVDVGSPRRVCTGSARWMLTALTAQCQ
ncbi:hypothetical protein PYCCODRAFT_327207 [Trametes coccinea BRFM310]|uniref:Uncharacterized protein n=1 Tax=Trametes coccinea (strain BRFM310) TaxID=1353009 RepID=A0A1Y2IND0_TRAC3|nr:hypothetical protein PYCCODRAFT_327207 [Trametes coccinea BRFM310]